MSAIRLKGFLDYPEVGTVFCNPNHFSTNIKHYYAFVDQKVKDLLLIARQTAKANGHITVELRDVLTTKGLQQLMYGCALTPMLVSFTECVLWRESSLQTTIQHSESNCACC